MLAVCPRRGQKLNAAPGGDNNLAVILSTYKPKIQCGSAQTFSDAPSCEGLLADMPASAAKVLFGPDDVPGVREPLPQLIASGKLSRDVHTPVSVLRPTEIQQVTTNVSSGSSPGAERTPSLGTASYVTFAVHLASSGQNVES